MRAVLAVLLGGVIAGALDIVYAFIFYGLRGVSPLRILQSIASGVLGSASYQGGLSTAALGLFLHFFITVTAAAIFYIVSRKLGWLVHHAVISGLLFGLAIYAFMNLLVVPLSAFPHKQSFAPLELVTGLLVHMFLVGLPIVLCVRAASARAPR